ncbi:MAG: RNA-binding domain-containing protein [Candidatus Rhabdochlamydia sp.]
MKYPGQESSKLEFKSIIPANAKIIKTIIGFCNAKGGKLVIGVKNDGFIEGISEDTAHQAMEWLDHAIYKACTPPILPLIYQQRINDKVLLIIEVSSGTNKPYYQKSLGLAEGTFIRLGRSTVKADANIIEELKWQSRGISYDQLPLYHTTIEDLDNTKIQYFLDHRRNGITSNLTEAVLRSYEIIKKEHSTDYVTAAGILLFGKSPQQFLSEAYILCCHFSDFKDREAIASRTCKGTLFEQFDESFDFIMERINKSFKIEKRKREEHWEIPPIAIREVLMNAILHRNYHINAPIKISIYSDRIEFFSPGGLPGPIDTSELESGITYVRNTSIAKILWEAKYIEKMGSGFITLFKSYRKEGLLPPEVIEGTNFVKCILPRVLSETIQEDIEAQILSLFKISDEISRADIIRQLNIPRTSAGRALNKLIKNGKLERYGKGPNTKYRCLAN